MTEKNKTVVLVVEDEPILLMDAVDIIEDAGFEVIPAPNADRAMEFLIGRRDIRIVVTDIQMPGTMNGLKLAAFIRDRWPPIQLIVMSAQRKPDTSELPSGALFFSKPWSPNPLLEAIRRFAS